MSTVVQTLESAKALSLEKRWDDVMSSRLLSNRRLSIQLAGWGCGLDDNGNLVIGGEDNFAFFKTYHPAYRPDFGVDQALLDLAFDMEIVRSDALRLKQDRGWLELHRKNQIRSSKKLDEVVESLEANKTKFASISNHLPRLVYHEFIDVEGFGSWGDEVEVSRESCFEHGDYPCFVNAHALRRVDKLKGVPYVDLRHLLDGEKGRARILVHEWQDTKKYEQTFAQAMRFSRPGVTVDMLDVPGLKRKPRPSPKSLPSDERDLYDIVVWTVIPARNELEFDDSVVPLRRCLLVVSSLRTEWPKVESQPEKPEETGFECVLPLSEVEQIVA